MTSRPGTEIRQGLLQQAVVVQAKQTPDCHFKVTLGHLAAFDGCERLAALGDPLTRSVRTKAPGVQSPARTLNAFMRAVEVQS